MPDDQNAAISRRSYLGAVGLGAGVGILATFGALSISQGGDARDATRARPDLATVSFSMVESSVPHAVSIEVTDWGDADGLRVYCPSAVETVQTVERGQQGLAIDGLGMTAGMLVESEHGEWRRTIAKRWIHGDPPHLEAEEPGLQKGAQWVLDEMNETEGDDAE